MQAEQYFFVGIQDVGENNELNDKAFLEAMGNVTNIHGKIVGQEMGNKAIDGLAWVVLNWKLCVYSRPKACESYLVKTWARDYSRAEANRDFDVYNADGALIAQATSKWAVVDTAAGSVFRLTPEFMDAYRGEPEHINFPGFRFMKPRLSGLTPVSSLDFTVNKSMIDANDHVHNTAYLDLAAEILPGGADKLMQNNVEISYRREIKPHETVNLELYEDGEKRCVVIRDRDDASLHAYITLY